MNNTEFFKDLWNSTRWWAQLEGIGIATLVQAVHMASVPDILFCGVFLICAGIMYEEKILKIQRSPCVTKKEEIFDIIFDVISLIAAALNMVSGAVYLYQGNRIEADLCFITGFVILIIIDVVQIRRDIKAQKENSEKTLEWIKKYGND